MIVLNYLDLIALQSFIVNTPNLVSEIITRKKNRHICNTIWPGHVSLLSCYLHDCINCHGGCRRMHLLYYCINSLRTHFLVNIGISMHMFSSWYTHSWLYIWPLYGIHNIHVCHSLSPLSLFVFCVAYVRTSYSLRWLGFPLHMLFGWSVCQFFNVNLHVCSLK